MQPTRLLRRVFLSSLLGLTEKHQHSQLLAFGLTLLLLDSFARGVMIELYFLTFIPMHHQGVLTLPLVKVKEKFQITLPAELREVLHLAVGDLLEATIQGQTIVLKPKDVVDRVQARQQLIEVMDRVHAKLPPSTQDPQEEEEEIAREIQAYRQEHAQRRR
jgi:AbrB family looped-hinge helix DNA binding protein